MHVNLKDSIEKNIAQSPTTFEEQSGDRNEDGGLVSGDIEVNTLTEANVDTEMKQGAWPLST